MKRDRPEGLPDPPPGFHYRTRWSCPVHDQPQSELYDDEYATFAQRLLGLDPADAIGVRILQLELAYADAGCATCEHGHEIVVRRKNGQPFLDKTLGLDGLQRLLNDAYAQGIERMREQLRAEPRGFGGLVE